MAEDTRQLLLDTAEILFAERGFYGVSIAAIAAEMGLSKQGLLHYFASKEKLYGAVLQRISDDFLEQQLDAEQSSSDPILNVKRFYARLVTPSSTILRRTRLLMRELLDNNDRAASVESWYLKDFLRRLVDMTSAVPAFRTLNEVQVLTLTYQWLGAVNYFLISPATLRAIFGAKMHCDMERVFLDGLHQQIEAQMTITEKRE